MPLKTNILAGIIAGAGGNSPLRTIATQNRPQTETFALTGGMDTVRGRKQWRVATDTKDLVINLNNIRVTQTTPLANTNSVQYSMVVEIGGVTYPVTLGGQAVFTLPPTAADINSDPIPAHVINGTNKVSRGSLVWGHWEGKVPPNGNILYGIEAPSAVAGQQSIRFSSANTVVSPLSSPGPTTLVSGTNFATSTTNFFGAPMLLGHPVVDGPSVFGEGDSILQNVGDLSANGVDGNGFFQRAMTDGTDAGLIPSINFGRSGSLATYFTHPDAAAYIHPYLKYCNIAVDEVLTNTIGLTPSAGVNLAYCQGFVLPIWEIFRANGIKKIIRTKLLPRTTSTDTWLTDANQTPITGWGLNEVADQCNAWFDSVNGTLIDRVVTCDFVRSASNRRLWKTDGSTARLYIAPADGANATHPNTNGHIGLAPELRTAILT